MPKITHAESAKGFDLSDDQMVTESDNAALRKSLEELKSFDDKGPAQKSQE